MRSWCFSLLLISVSTVLVIGSSTYGKEASSSVENDMDGEDVIMNGLQQDYHNTFNHVHGFLNSLSALMEQLNRRMESVETHLRQSKEKMMERDASLLTAIQLQLQQSSENRKATDASLLKAIQSELRQSSESMKARDASLLTAFQSELRQSIENRTTTDTPLLTAIQSKLRQSSEQMKAMNASLLTKIQLQFEQSSENRKTSAASLLTAIQRMETVVNYNAGQEADRKSSQDSILKAVSSMNATIVGIDQRMQRVEDKVSNVQGTVARIDKLEPIQIAQAEQERRKRELTKRLIVSPRAKLCTGLNYTGDLESYDFKAPTTMKGGCYDLKNLQGKIKSVNTEGTCVRIFKGTGCTKWSQAIYPGSSVTIDAKLEGVRSLGPCVRNEFEYSTLTMSGYPPVVTVNKRAEEVAVFANVPDLVPDYWANPRNFLSLNNTEPIVQYSLGQGGRLEAVAANIYPRHILSSDIAEGNRLAGLNQSFFSNLGMIPLTDEPGHIVPLELGGPAKEAYNVFAQDKGQAAKYRAFLVSKIKQHLVKYPDGNVIIFAGALLYQDAASKRPAGIWYRIFAGVIDEVTYGYFPNVVLGLRG